MRRRFTAAERAELGPLLARIRWLMENAPDDALFEQLREIVCSGSAPTIAELAERVQVAEAAVAAYRPRRETAYWTNIRLLKAKGLNSTQIADEIGSTPGSVRQAIHRMRRLDEAA